VSPGPAENKQSDMEPSPGEKAPWMDGLSGELWDRAGLPRNERVLRAGPKIAWGWTLGYALGIGSFHRMADFEEWLFRWSAPLMKDLFGPPAVLIENASKEGEGPAESIEARALSVGNLKMIALGPNQWTLAETDASGRVKNPSLFTLQLNGIVHLPFTPSSNEPLNDELAGWVRDWAFEVMEREPASIAALATDVPRLAGWAAKAQAIMESRALADVARQGGKERVGAKRGDSINVGDASAETARRGSRL
jgi:hypothetical protein